MSIGPAVLPGRVPLTAQTWGSGTGISTCSPSPTPCGLGLGPTNPERIILAQEPWGFRRGGFAPPFALLIPASALAPAPPLLALRLPCRRDAPLPSLPGSPHPRVWPSRAVIHSLGTRLDPRYIVGAGRLDQ